MLAIRLSPDMEARLDSLAKKTGRTKTFYAREAINRLMNEMEEYYLVESIAQEVESGKMKTYTLDQVVKQLGLDN